MGILRGGNTFAEREIQHSVPVDGGRRDQPLVTKGRNQWAKRLKMSSAVKMAVKKMSTCRQQMRTKMG